MLRRERTASPEGFEQELERLRMRIDLLPELQRPHLYELADTIKRQHRRTKKHEYPNDENA